MSENIGMTDKVKLQKFTFDYVDAKGDNLIYSIQSKVDGLTRVKLPFNFNKIHIDEFTATLELAEGTPEKIEDLEYFKYLVQGQGDLSDEVVKRYDDQKRQSIVLKDLPEEYFVQERNENQDFPKMIYCDVTEKDMFGEEEISATNLLENNGSGGIWGNHGLRKLEVVVKGLPDMPKEGEITDLKERANLYWYKRDSEDIPNIFENDIRYILPQMDVADDKGNDERKYIAYLNTNVLGESAEAAKDSVSPEFSGRFELRHEYMDEIIIYSFPIKICVHNTSLDEKNNNHLLVRNVVSIDFGTSSTCAAVKGTGKAHLFTLSGKEKRKDNDDNPYENPTNIMIYDWDRVYRQWQMDNDNCPFVLTKSEIRKEDESDYDSGYTVEDEYKSVDDEAGRRRMAAILTQIKLIPYMEANGKQVKFTPYGGKSRTAIRVTDSIDPADNTNQKLNPIAFYGYLLSRAINKPQENKFYQNYLITYPVKFDKDVREKIRASLEYGIKRALPKPLRDARNKKGESLVSVKMKYAEPVACVGAIVGKQLQISENDAAAKLFAVYDLGGGTLDFAFGIFRKATEEEQEEEDVALAIEILGIGGDDKVGGEKLIHKLAYKIYCDSKNEMEKNEIKFVIPQGELSPKGFEGLLSKRGDEISDTNVNLIKERLARYLFKAKEGVNSKLTDLDLPEKATDGTHYKMTLRNKDGLDKEVNLEVKEVDDFLEQEIKSTITSFEQEMRANFERNIDRIKQAGIQNFKVGDVHIFLGGNASKQHYVEEVMANVFKDNEIKRIREEENEEENEKRFVEESDKYKLNEKTAVAFGQLALGQYLVLDDAIAKEDGVPPFLFNVGYNDPGTGEYVPVLHKNDISREWHKANRIDRESLMTNLLYTTDPQCNPNSMKPLEEDVSDAVTEKGRTLYIRIYEEDSIEYRVGKNNEDFSASDEPVSSMILKLKVLED